MAFQQHEFVDINIHISDESELKLISPFACFVVGCTGSGKSWTVLKWLKNPGNVFRNKYTKIYYYYGSTHQDVFNQPSLKHIHFSNDLKALEKLVCIKHKSPGILLILDDLMDVVGNSKIIEQLYAKGSHHFNIDVINIVQNIFYKANNFVTLKENTQYMFIKRIINESKVPLLASQIGLNPAELKAAYMESVNNRNRYEGLLIDNHIDSNIRKVAKIRDMISSDTPGLYVTDENFEYYRRRNVLREIDASNYYLDFELLKDTACV